MTRPMVTIGIPFLITVWVVSFLSLKSSLIIAVFLIIQIPIIFIIKDKKKRIVIFTVIISSVIGVLAYSLYTKTTEFDQTKFDGESGSITATILEISRGTNGKASYTIRVSDSDIDGMPDNFKAILYAGKELNVDYYSEITIKATARMFNAQYLPYYRSKGIMMSFSSFADADKIKPQIWNPFYYPKKLNEKLCSIFDRYVDSPYNGLAKAILLGSDDDINMQIENSVIRAGVSHIFVVSGMHISLIAMLFLNLLKKLKIKSKVTNSITIFAAWGMVALTGFGIPAIRAGIMITVMLLAKIINRRADTLNSLFLSGIIIVVAFPPAIKDVSFLLTFTATLGIVLLTDTITNWACRTFRLKRQASIYIANNLSMTVAANLAAFPVTVCAFKGISLIAPVVNLLIVPILPMLLIICLLLIAFSFIAPIARLIGTVIELAMRMIVLVCDLLGGFDFSFLGLNYDFVFIWLVVSIIITVIAIFLFRKSAGVLHAVGACILGLGICFFGNYCMNAGSLQIYTINSFEATGVAIAYGDKVTVVTFGDDSRLDIKLEESMRSKNLHSIDNYIFAQPCKKNISDTDFLSAVMDVERFYLMEDDPLVPYADSCLRANEPLSIIEDDKEIILLLDNYGTLKVHKDETGTTLTLYIGASKVIITDSIDFAENEKCEILYFYSNTNEILTQNQAKCVILLNGVFENTKQVKSKLENVIVEPTDVYIKKNGGFKLS